MGQIKARLNYGVTLVLGLLGITMISEVIMETDPIDKLDDGLMVVLSIVAIYWYKKRGHLGTSSSWAVIFSFIAVLIKIMAILIEKGDAAAVGDDIGILVTLILLFLFTLWQVYFQKKPIVS